MNFFLRKYKLAITLFEQRFKQMQIKSSSSYTFEGVKVTK